MVQIVKLLDRLQVINIPGGFVPKGAYAAGTDYAVGDSVDYNGSSYVMYADAAAGTAPTDTDYWQLVAEKGDPGPASESSGITRTVVVTSGDVTAAAEAATDYVYLVAGAHTLIMPTAASNTNRYTIKNNHSANITIDTTSTETIDGADTVVLAPEESIDLVSDTTNWRVL